MKLDPDAPARDKILFHLKTKGPQTASQLARRLDVTPMAIRQHLARLDESGLVDYTDERRKVGRPARLWSLTEAAQRRFPDSHADLTVEIMDSVRETFGEEGLDRLIRQRTRHQLKGYRARMPDKGAPLEKRVARLAELRREEGYMAEWSRQRGGAFLLTENHCPICIAARSCTGLCRDELKLFRSVLGPGVRVERVEHLLSGARRCAYLVEPS